jgi:mannitol-specific phosphotransferase system IIBC component
MKETVQRFGSLLARMICTSIGALIAWGLDRDNLITI